MQYIRTASLKAVLEVLNTPSLKLRGQRCEVVVMYDNNVQTLQRTLPTVLTALEREEAENGEPVAIGVTRVMKYYKFVACLNHVQSSASPFTSTFILSLSSKVREEGKSTTCCCN